MLCPDVNNLTDTQDGSQGIHKVGKGADQLFPNSKHSHADAASLCLILPSLYAEFVYLFHMQKMDLRLVCMLLNLL